MSVPGNKNAVALKDPKVRQRAYESFCKHISKGKSVKSWWFDEDGLTCTWETFYKYIKGKSVKSWWFDEDGLTCTWETFYKYIKDKTEFDPIKKELAHCKGLAHWEEVVEKTATGENDKASVPCLQMLMRNKFGWDKPEENSSNTHYTIRVNNDGIATGVSTETLSNTDHKGSK